MLWGISVRFQTLSPIQRQVAHALLTRPPLSYSDASRRIDLNNSVRLECVMHAASVHPEPGSNSRKMFIISKVSLGYNSSSYFFLASFTLLSIYSLVLTRSALAYFFALYFSLVVQFSMTKALFLPPCRADSLTIIPHHFSFVNTFFEIFFVFLKVFFKTKNRKRNNLFFDFFRCWQESPNML